MNDPKLLKPVETTALALAIGEKKANSSFRTLLILGFLGGAFIAFASQASTMGAFNLLALPAWYGLGKVVAGLIFGGGLVFVLMAGTELFTGNVLITNAWLCGRVSLYRLLRNWVIVFMANLLGSLCIAWLLSQSGLWHSGANMLGGMTIKLAVGKVTLTFGQALALGILCNWLVCLAVWLSFSTTSTTGKILGIYLPIFMFIVSGFEHSVANMYYIPAGILAASDPSYVAQATALGVTPDALAQLGWGSFFINNLLPVSLGNIIGGAVFIGMALMYGNGRPDEALIQAMKEKVLK